MAINSHISDPKTGRNAQVVDGEEEANALVVATRPLKTFENKVQYFISSTYGFNMNIGLTNDINEYINDGGDNTYWTASVIVGAKWTLDSTDQNHTGGGSQSIKYSNGNTNDILQILNNTDIILTNYNTLVLWIYVNNSWATGDSVAIYGWDNETGTQVGNSVFLEDYFTFGDFAIWQQITIPLLDLNLTAKTIDAIRIQIITKSGVSPTFYLDDIQLEGTIEEAGAGIFKVTPNIGTWLYVNKITIAIADAYTAIIATGADTNNATLPGLAYNKILGETALSSGILYQRIQDGAVEFSVIIKQLSDLLQLPGAILKNAISDGTNTFLSIDVDYTEPIILKAENNDTLQMVVNDNLSGLLLLRMSVTGKIENREEYLEKL